MNFLYYEKILYLPTINIKKYCHYQHIKKEHLMQAEKILCQYILIKHIHKVYIDKIYEYEMKLSTLHCTRYKINNELCKTRIISKNTQIQSFLNENSEIFEEIYRIIITTRPK